MWCRYHVVLHVAVQDVDEWVLGAARPLEVVHVDSPGHSSQVALLLDEVHLELDTCGVFIANPLCTCTETPQGYSRAREAWAARQAN